MVVPGTYSVVLEKVVDGVATELAPPQSFETEALGTASLPAEDKAELLAFQQETASLQRAVLGAIRAADYASDSLALFRKAIIQAPAAERALIDETRALEERLDAIEIALSGDPIARRRSEPSPPSIRQRVQGIVSGHWTSTSAPTESHRESLRIAGEAFAPVLEHLRTLMDRDMRTLAEKLDAAGAPWTPGRLPSWKRR